MKPRKYGYSGLNTSVSLPRWRMSRGKVFLSRIIWLKLTLLGFFKFWIDWLRFAERPFEQSATFVTLCFMTKSMIYFLIEYIIFNIVQILDNSQTCSRLKIDHFKYNERKSETSDLNGKDRLFPELNVCANSRIFSCNRANSRSR